MVRFRPVLVAVVGVIEGLVATTSVLLLGTTAGACTGGGMDYLFGMKARSWGVEPGLGKMLLSGSLFKAKVLMKLDKWGRGFGVGHLVEKGGVAKVLTVVK